MKKAVLLLVLLTVSRLAGAQIVLDSTAWKYTGTSIRYDILSNTGLSVGQAGANQNYDFSGGTVIDSSSAAILPITSSSHQAEHPEADWFGIGCAPCGTGETVPDTVWDYYASNSQGFIRTSIGAALSAEFGNQYVSAQYQPAADTIVSRNMRYGYNKTYSFGYYALVNGDTFHSSQFTKTMQADAWGRMKTKYGTWNVLRFKISRTEYQRDLDSNGNLYGHTDTANSYEWHTNGSVAPLVTLKMSSDWNTIANAVVLKMVQTNIEKENVVWVKASIMPNPFHDQTRITVENANPSSHYTFILTDMLGRIIRAQQFTGTNTILDRSGLPDGLYFYQLKDNRNQQIASGRLLAQ